MDRRQFLKISGTTLGASALISVAPAMGSSLGTRMRSWFRSQNGEAPAPFTLIQLSDAHVGFSGPPNPTGTKAFERAIETINGIVEQPDLILFTGDLTHESETPGEHAKRMKLFKSLSNRLRASKVMYVPGEHDAALDGGELYRQFFGETYYSFDHKGVHFIALDNVSRGKPTVGSEQLAWLKRDLARFPATTPIIVFTHRPLFNLRTDWEWYTKDGADVMNALAPYENVTVLYGHIHRHDVHQTDHATHYASKSLIFGFPDPTTTGDKKPVAFNKDNPFQNLGLQRITSKRPMQVDDIELTVDTFSGMNAAMQISRTGAFV